ncbi:MAG: hypothetical protein B7X02_00265, partial [Rhodospirillales bacterium 12-54-5]
MTEPSTEIDAASSALEELTPPKRLHRLLMDNLAAGSFGSVRAIISSACLKVFHMHVVHREGMLDIDGHVFDKQFFEPE